MFRFGASQDRDRTQPQVSSPISREAPANEPVSNRAMHHRQVDIGDVELEAVVAGAGPVTVVFENGLGTSLGSRPCPDRWNGQVSAAGSRGLEGDPRSWRCSTRSRPGDDDRSETDYARAAARFIIASLLRTSCSTERT